MVYQDNYMVILNSAYATQKNNSTANSNLNFSFIGLLKQDDDILRTEISIVNAQFPISFYIINSLNNKIYCSYNSLFYTITLTQGNYNAFDFITEMTTKFTISGLSVTPTINRNTGVLSFTSAFAFQIRYDGTTCASILGLGTTDSILGTSFTLPYPLNLLGVKKLIIRSTSLAIIAYSSKTLTFTDIICTVPCDQPYFNMISYINQNDLNRNLLKAPYIDGIDIQIVDEYDNLIDFHNQDWAITIVISNTRNDKVQDNIKFNDFITSLKINNIEKPTLPIIPPTLPPPTLTPPPPPSKPISEDKKILDFLQK